MRYMNTGEGLHRFVDPADGQVYLYSQFEVADTRRMFPVFEQPDLKATFQFSVTAPADWAVVSNQPSPEPVAVSDGVARWDFSPTPVMSCYVTALIAGVLIGMVQAATSINEQTLSFIPKIIVVGAMLALFGGSIMVLIADFTREIFERIPDLLQ